MRTYRKRPEHPLSSQGPRSSSREGQQHTPSKACCPLPSRLLATRPGAASQLQKRKLQLPAAPRGGRVKPRRSRNAKARARRGWRELEKRPSAVLPSRPLAPTTRPLLKPSARYLSPGLSVLFPAAAGAVLSGLRWQRGGDDPGAGDEGKPGLAGMQRLVMSAPLTTAA